MPLAGPPHLLVSLRGDLGAAGQSPEHWQCGLRFDAAGGLVVSEAAKTAVVNRAKAWITSANMVFTGAVHLTEVRFAQISDTGAQEGATAVEPALASGVKETDTNPWQDSMVVTLVTEGRGKGTKGRIYLPPQGLAVSSATGMLNSPSFADDIATACASFFDGLNSDLSRSLIVLGHAGKTGPASAKVVTKVRVGHVIDTMRSRRRALAESYVEKPLTP